MAQEYSPTEIFKRATAATLRAIAERDDVTVGFGPEAAGVSGARVRLPNPPRDLPIEEAAQLRGAAVDPRGADQGAAATRGATCCRSLASLARRPNRQGFWRARSHDPRSGC